jgi:hypothetical protein
MSEKMNEEQLKNILGINNWRELSKDKLFDFIRLSPNIDKEVYIRIVEQIPNFVALTSEIIKNIIAIGEQKKEITSEIIGSLNLIIASLDKFAQKDDLTAEERKLYIDSIIDVAKILERININEIEFQKEIIQKITAISGLALTVLGVVFGLQKVSVSKNPFIKR